MYKKNKKIKLIVDTREQLSFTFNHEKYKDAALQTASLNIGDYSILGFENYVAAERKSLPDLVGCLGRDRTRFEKELQRGRALDAFAVVVEASWLDLAKGEYRSQLKPHAASQSVVAFMARYNIPFFFAGSRPAAEYVTYSFLKQYLNGVEKTMRAIQKHM